MKTINGDCERNSIITYFTNNKENEDKKLVVKFI
jgi:hypothetical protein